MYIIMYKYSAFKIKHKPFSFRYIKVVLRHPGHSVMAEHLRHDRPLEIAGQASNDGLSTSWPT